jgi:ubiquinone/menaquinone biosynthesis C-methylase UbiE
VLTPKRVESHELLDEGNVPRADMERSLRDLRRINKYLGGTGIYKRLLNRFEARSVLDIGAGTADDLEAIPHVPLRIGLDFKIEHLLYLRDGSRVLRVVGDAQRLPFRDGAVDVVTSAHFFHHFGPDDNVTILREALRVAKDGVTVNDTRRHYVPLLFVHLLGALRLIGKVTRNDAPASVRQAYTLEETRAIAERVKAKFQIVRMWPFRLGILLWKT